MDTMTTADTEQVARRFHALSDVTRLQIVQLLAQGERCVCDLTDALDAAQSRLSFHLKALKTAGLVSARRQGRWMYYSLRPEVLDEMAAFIGKVKPESCAWGEPGDGCCG